jgi:hypothetical protein
MQEGWQRHGRMRNRRAAAGRPQDRSALPRALPSPTRPTRRGPLNRQPPSGPGEEGVAPAPADWLTLFCSAPITSSRVWDGWGPVSGGIPWLGKPRELDSSAGMALGLTLPFPCVPLAESPWRSPVGRRWRERRSPHRRSGPGPPAQTAPTGAQPQTPGPAQQHQLAEGHQAGAEVLHHLPEVARL